VTRQADANARTPLVLDAPVRHGRTGVARRIRQFGSTSALFVAPSVVGAVAVPFLPDDVHRPWVLALSGVAFLFGLVLPWLPWERWGRRAQIAPLLYSFCIFGPGMGYLGNALTYYLAMITLSFVFIGFAQPPRTSWKIAPVALGIGALGTIGAQEPMGLLVQLFLTVATATVVGEVVAMQVSSLKAARRSVDSLVTGITGLTGAEDLTEAATRASRSAAALLRADIVAMLLPEEGTPDRYRYSGGHNSPLAVDEVVVDGAVQPSGALLAAAHGRPVFIRDAPSSEHVAPENLERFRIASVLYVPMTGENGFAGVMTVIWHRHRSRLGGMALRAALLLADEAGKHVERLRRTAKLAHEAETDALTGLPNRRAFFRELAELKPDDAVLFLDLDHFKRLNDALGHQVGDEELAAFAATLAAHTRGSDCSARYGGEEFGVIVRGDGVRGVDLLVGRLREAWAECGRTTFSAGAAIHRGGAPADTLAAADRALYDAKDTGRNRLCWSLDDPDIDSATVHPGTDLG
jgi:diguanylate cyclase (GGDEF)-like protein